MFIAGNGDIISEFYMGFFDGSLFPAIVLATSEQYPVLYSVEAPGIGFYVNGTICPDSETAVRVPSSLIVRSYKDEDKGIYVKTDSYKVTVIGSSGETLLGKSQSGWRLETYTAIPITDLCVDEYEYFAISAKASYRDNSIVLVVGTEDNTDAKLTVTQPVTISVDNTTTNLTAGKEYSFIINRLQTLYIASPDDLSGTRIVTSKPVTVLSGHEHMSAADLWNKYFGFSLLIEQMPPTALWGKLHYVTDLANVWSGYSVKILALKHCSIFMYCNETLSVTLHSGEFVFKHILNYGSCSIHSTERILVMQFSPSPDLEFLGARDYRAPVMITVPPTGQYYNTFTLLPYQPQAHEVVKFLHHVSIIVLVQYYQPDMIYLISGGVNKSLDTQEWIPILVNNSIEAYTAQVNIPAEGIIEIIHIDPSALMTIILYGSMMHGGYATAITLPHGQGMFIAVRYLSVLVLTKVYNFKQYYDT